VHCAMGGSIPHSVPTWFINPMAASKIGPQDYPLDALFLDDKTKRRHIKI
jgi:hypothetical protein